MSNTSPDLPEKWLKIIKNILKEYIPHRNVWLYGSRVNGTSYESSDIDLVFFPPKSSDEITTNKMFSMELKRQQQLKEVFRDSSLPVFVDVLSWMVIPDEFKEQISSEKHILL